jgi:hypothetical protein
MAVYRVYGGKSNELLDIDVNFFIKTDHKHT